MRGWKLMSRLKNETTSKQVIKEEAGITLVELLAVLAILSVVIMLGGAVHMFGQRQFTAQTESASQANDLSYALTVMSTEIRKESADEIEVNEEKNEVLLNGTPYFYVQNNKLYQDGAVTTENVSKMTVNKDDRKIEIILTSSSSNNPSNKEYSTTIYFRR